MATIRKRGDYQWQAIVKRKGHYCSRTFDYKADAEKWSRKTEREIDQGTFAPENESLTTTLFKALERYAREVTPGKKGQAREINRIKRWQEHPLAKKTLAGIKGSDLAKFRDDRRTADKVSDATIRLELMLLSAIYKRARTDWGMVGLASPLASMTLPAGSRKRERRLRDGEEDTLLEFITKAMPRTPYARELLELDLETGMRQSEILGIEWNDIRLKQKHIHLDETKSGDPRDVPLSPRAIQIIESIPRPISGGRLFNVTQDRLIRGFIQACKLGRESHEDPSPGFLENLKFHDLRHEAASRWASILEAHELCKMFGWKTMQMALRYYHPTGQSIAEKLAYQNNKYHLLKLGNQKACEIKGERRQMS